MAEWDIDKVFDETEDVTDAWYGGGDDDSTVVRVETPQGGTLHQGRVDFAYEFLVAAARRAAGKSYGESFKAVNAEYQRINGGDLIVPAHIAHECIIAGNSGFGALRGACAPVMADSFNWADVKGPYQGCTVSLAPSKAGGPVIGSSGVGLSRVARAAGGAASEAAYAVTMLAMSTGHVGSTDDALGRCLEQAANNVLAANPRPADLAAVITRSVPSLFSSSRWRTAYSLGAFHHSQVVVAGTANITRVALCAAACYRASADCRPDASARATTRAFIPRVSAYEPPAPVSAVPVVVPKEVVNAELVAEAESALASVGRGVVWAEEGGRYVPFAARDKLVPAATASEASAAALVAALLRARRPVAVTDDVIMSEGMTKALGTAMSPAVVAALPNRRDAAATAGAMIVDFIARRHQLELAQAVAASYAVTRASTHKEALRGKLQALCDKQVVDAISGWFASGAGATPIGNYLRYCLRTFTDRATGTTLEERLASAVGTATGARLDALDAAARVHHQRSARDVASVDRARQWDPALYGTTADAVSLRRHARILAAIRSVAPYAAKVITPAQATGLATPMDEDAILRRMVLAGSWADAVEEDEEADAQSVEDEHATTLEEHCEAVAAILTSADTPADRVVKRYLNSASRPIMPRAVALAMTSASAVHDHPRRDVVLAAVRQHIHQRARSVSTEAGALHRQTERSATETRRMYRQRALARFLQAWLASPNGEVPDIGCTLYRTARNMSWRMRDPKSSAIVLLNAEAEYSAAAAASSDSMDYAAHVNSSAKTLDDLARLQGITMDISFTEVARTLKDAVTWPYVDSLQATPDTEAREPRPAPARDTLAGAVIAAVTPTPREISEATPEENLTEFTFDFDVSGVAADVEPQKVTSDATPSEAILGTLDPVFDAFWDSHRAELAGLSDSAVAYHYDAFLHGQAPVEEIESGEETVEEDVIL